MTPAPGGGDTIVTVGRRVGLPRRSSAGAAPAGSAASSAVTS